jgi:hypothetical protein
MLVLERTYPDNATSDEKQRIIEHALRRASEMGIAVAYPTEYYWDVRKTNRFAGNAAVEEMNEVLKDLNRRYGTRSQKQIMQVINRAGNTQQEYIDSAPPNGAAGRGQVGVRQYPGNQDVQFENEFLILEPVKG